MSKKVVTFGEIMLRLATPGYQRFSQATEFTATFGGGEANVSVSLANYGMESEFVTRLPQNDIARSCEMDLHKHGVKTDHVIYGGDRLGIYFLETGAVARASKVVYDRAHSAIAEIKPGMIDWDKVLKGAGLVSLDRYYPRTFTRCCRRLSRGHTGSQPSGRNRIVRPELPEKPVEIRQTGIRNHARAGSRLRCHTGK